MLDARKFQICLPEKFILSPYPLLQAIGLYAIDVIVRSRILNKFVTLNPSGLNTKDKECVI